MKGDRIHNTGKVQIGSNYTPPPLREQTQEELRIQRMLLDQKDPNAGMQMLAYMLVLLIVVLALAAVAVFL